MIPVTPTTPMAFGQTHKPQFVANAGATKTSMPTPSKSKSFPFLCTGLRKQ